MSSQNTSASSSSSSPPQTQYTAFRQAEKHFKNRAHKGHLPSIRKYLPTLVDLSRPRSGGQEEDPVWKAGWWSPENDVDPASVPDGKKKNSKGKEREKGERPEIDYSDLERIKLSDGRKGYIVAPGCILIPQYLSIDQQLELLHSALAEYTRPPNPLSISTHYDLPPNLFDLYATAPNTLVEPKHLHQQHAQQQRANSEPTTDQDGSKAEQQPTKARGRQLIETEPASVLGYEEIVARNKTWTGDIPSDKLGIKTVEQVTREMRWANLGWVYQWSTKSYDFSRDKPIPFPPQLAAICSEVVSSVPWGEVFSGQSPDAKCGWENWPKDYAPDTGIVNFYQIKDTLMGHVDRSELDPARPLVSLSIGHAAVLLLGSASRHDPPRPIIIRSGDCLIMSGSGRQAYHGVPRILEGTLPSHFELSPADSDPSSTSSTMKAAKQFIASARININARQVFPPGFTRPTSSK
ncbi:alkylated DNA repair protein AlkB [Kwoniella heveanensis CBS 569]|nr:alkylated DNA repair protein AlkB [Kwoniella heveanensis CBS 569]